MSTVHVRMGPQEISDVNGFENRIVTTPWPGSDGWLKIDGTLTGPTAKVVLITDVENIEFTAPGTYLFKAPQGDVAIQALVGVSSGDSISLNSIEIIR